MRLSVSSAEKAKLFSSRIGTGTGRAPVNSIISDSREAGIWIKDVGAWFAEHQDRHEHGRLAAGEDHHGVRRDVDIEPFMQIGGDRLAQRQDADRRRVTVVAVAQRLHRRLDDEIGRAKIRLTNSEIDDVAALRRKLCGARENSERVLLTDAIECSNGLQHGRHLNSIVSQKQTFEQHAALQHENAD